MRKHRLLKVLAVVAVVFVLAAATLGAVVQSRLAAQRAGEGAVGAPSEPVQLAGEKTGRFTAHVDYTSMAAAADAQVSTDVVWDDDWFFADPTEYNHELATTCSVLSAIANSESAYYQAGSGSPAYMEEALAALGFEDVSTASYQYRSEIIDEVVCFLTNTMDVTAYTVATKHITNSQTGEEKVLLMVSVRGSYGSEWLSDANMGSSSGDDLPGEDHVGFTDAADEILGRLIERVDALKEDEGIDVDDVALLFTGHSRGAATANIAAAYADQIAESSVALARSGSIYAYTFACPRSTRADDAQDSAYDNIFNVLNPSDMVPRLPLSTWGYARYGRDLWLPEEGMEGFDELYAQMKETFFANVGSESPYVPSDNATVDAFEEELGVEVATQEDFETLGGVAAVVKSIATDMDVMQVLYGHYPNTYIAWMQVIGEDDLRVER